MRSMDGFYRGKQSHNDLRAEAIATLFKQEFSNDPGFGRALSHASALCPVAKNIVPPQKVGSKSCLGDVELKLAKQSGLGRVPVFNFLSKNSI